jgi:hypothetical protein
MRYKKYLFLLSLLNLLFIVTGYFFIDLGIINTNLADIIILSLSFSVIGLVAFIIFIRGQKKNAGEQTFHSLVAVSIKFLLELVLTFIWFFLAKKTSLLSVLIFFLLYLSLSLFFAWMILKTLKNRSL